MSSKKRKAFTLTELLVVVVIIGVLSAVVLPKFTKVMESRKTSEAEEMMSAVRNEQEARCTISKNYQKDLGKLASYRAGKNFTYADLDGVGMTATASSGKYTLKMPSYADGRICCDDEYCQNSLNKSYPKCNELSNFVAGNASCNADWAAEGGYTEGEEPTPSECTDGQEEEQACTNNCGEAGTQKNRCVSGHWQGWGACSAADKASCGEPPTGKCKDGETNKLGETTGGCAEVLLSCVNGEWVYPPQTVLKPGNDCWKDEGNKACVNCHLTDACPAGKEKIDGVCCLPGQKVVNGKCLYKYRPNRFDVGILVVCHASSWELATGASSIISEEQFNSGYMGYKQQYGSYEAYKNAQIAELTKGRHIGGSNPPYCSRMGTAYYRGGHIPWVTDGVGCDPHYSYYYGGNWWAGGERVTGTKVFGTDQEWCDTNCGPSPSCSKKGMIDYGNPPATCGAYHCENGWHCDNAPGGTGVALECIRE